MTRDEKLVAKFMFMACGNLQAVQEATQLPEKQLNTLARVEGWEAQFKTLTKKIDPILKQSVQRRIEKFREKHINFVLDTLEENEDNMRLMVPSTEKDANISPERKMFLLDKHDQIARRTLGLDNDEKEDPMKDAFKFLVAKQMNEAGVVGNKVHEVETEVDFNSLIDEDYKSPEGLDYKSHSQSAIMSLPAETNATTGILTHAVGVSKPSFEPLDAAKSSEKADVADSSILSAAVGIGEVGKDAKNGSNGTHLEVESDIGGQPMKEHQDDSLKKLPKNLFR